MEQFELVIQEGIEAIEKCLDKGELEQVRVTYFGKKGVIAMLMQKMRDLPNEERPAYGQSVHHVCEKLEGVFEKHKEKIDKLLLEQQIANEKIDITMDGLIPNIGNLHPLHIVQQEIEDVFIGLGYVIGEGPEVELDLYNFERANIPKDHPARDMQDTFYINAEELLRTHTTAIQTRVLEESAPILPIKVICPGKTYRRDDDDATHSHQFTQCEGLVVAENISLTDLKGTLMMFAKKMFGEDRVIRFRPSYFQFTEPSVEVDVSCHICNGKGCPVCKGSGWIEILGAGMVHPSVLEMAGYDVTKAQGFAFGVGIERVAMLKYGVSDIRDFYTNDLRFLKAFKRFE